MRCERNSSFELLRIILMVLIIIHHCIVHGLGLSGLSSSFSSTVLNISDSLMPSAITINAFCISAVNCFMLLSGYFSIKVNAYKVINIVLTLFFYSLLFTIIPYCVVGNWRAALSHVFFLSHSPYWFVIDYLFLMVFAPMLNLAFVTFSPIKRRAITLVLLIISCYFGFLWSHIANRNGYTLLQFITMYCIGREIAISKLSISFYKALVMYILGSLLCATACWYFWLVGQGQSSWKFTFYNDPLLLVSSLGLFMMFKALSFQSNLINQIAKSAFGIYLFQSSIFISESMYEWIRMNLLHFLNWGTYIIIVGLSIVTAIVAIICDRVRILITDYLSQKIFRIYKLYEIKTANGFLKIVLKDR